MSQQRKGRFFFKELSRNDLAPGRFPAWIKQLGRQKGDHITMTLLPYLSNRLTGSSSDLTELLGWNAPAASAPIRFHEDKDGYQAELDLPGVAKEGVHLNVEGLDLTLSAERQVGFGDAKRTVAYTRGLTLPDNVQVDAIKAEMRDGVLRLAFPKREELKPKHLKIDVA